MDQERVNTVECLVKSLAPFPPGVRHVVLSLIYDDGVIATAQLIRLDEESAFVPAQSPQAC